ncbi:unnamed protein product, partial [Iphiclides podalirius]
MEHCWFLVHGLYCIFCCMERRKKPCGSQLQLVSRSGSELSSLEQPESLDSRRASSMLTSTECRSRSSAPHAIDRSRCTDTDGGRRLTVRPLRRAARTYPRDLLAGRRPSRESESGPGPRAPPLTPRRPRSPRALLTVHVALECAAAAPRWRPATRAGPARVPATRELGHEQLGPTTGSVPGDVSPASRPTSMRARSQLGRRLRRRAAAAGRGRTARWPNFLVPSIHCALYEWPIIGHSAASDRPPGQRPLPRKQNPTPPRTSCATIIDNYQKKHR